MNSIIIHDITEVISNRTVDWSRFDNKTVLVTGANGMLPSYIVYTLLMLVIQKHMKIKVIAQVRNKSKGEIVFKDFLDCENFALLVQDVQTPYSMNEDVDFVVHAASQASPKYYETDPVGTLMANVQGTINILKLAVEKQCESVLFFSSSEIYGKSTITNISENDYGYLDPTSIRSCYAESKRMGEQLCCAWNAQYGTHCKSVRVFHTYGPNMNLDDGRVFADFVKNVINSEDIILKSHGRAKRAYCYVTDATVAFFKILLDGVDNMSYNMGNPNQEVSVLELSSILVNLYPQKGLKVKIELDERNQMHNSAVESVLPDIQRLSELGWSPQISITEGFKRVIDSKINK